MHTCIHGGCNENDAIRAIHTYVHTYIHTCIQPGHYVSGILLAPNAVTSPASPGACNEDEAIKALHTCIHTCIHKYMHT